MPVQGGASLPELAQQSGVLQGAGRSSAIDERVQAIEVSCLLTKRLCSGGFVRKLESANQAEDRFAIVRVSLKRHAEVMHGFSSVAFGQCHVAAQCGQGSVVAFARFEQALGPIRLPAINGDPNADDQRHRIVSRQRRKH